VTGEGALSVKIAVAGTGDVGLCAGTCFADSRHEGADGLFVATGWNELRKPNLHRVRRHIFDPRKMREPGFRDFGISRPTV
jgi:UDP-glucose 6-dehydrogenase